MNCGEHGTRGPLSGLRMQTDIRHAHLCVRARSTLALFAGGAHCGAAGGASVSNPREREQNWYPWMALQQCNSLACNSLACNAFTLG